MPDISQTGRRCERLEGSKALLSCSNHSVHWRNDAEKRREFYAPLVRRRNADSVTTAEPTAIRIEAPNADAIELERSILSEHPNRCEVVAFLDLAALHSPPLHKFSLAGGTDGERYAKLDAHLRLECEVGGEMKLTHRLAFGMVRPDDRKFCNRFLSTSRHLWELVRSWWSDAAHFLASCVLTSIDALQTGTPFHPTRLSCARRPLSAVPHFLFFALYMRIVSCTIDTCLCNAPPRDTCEQSTACFTMTPAASR